MSTKANFKKLLGVSKKTLRFLLQEDQSESSRQKMISELRTVLDEVELYDCGNLTLSLTMTRGTHTALQSALEKRDDGSDLFRQLIDAVVEGTRITKQRVFINLDINHGILRLLKRVLLTTATRYQDGAFRRLADQIDRDGLSKNPLEILAKMSL